MSLENKAADVAFLLYDRWACALSSGGGPVRGVAVGALESAEKEAPEAEEECEDDGTAALTWVTQAEELPRDLQTVLHQIQERTLKLDLKSVLENFLD